MTRLLIITGPQGSGNHLFSKCLAVHEDVHEDVQEYWLDDEVHKAVNES